MDTNLYDVLSRKSMPPVSEHRAKWIMWQVLKALDFVHSKGIFHRDIKPENILVRGDVHSVPIPFPDSNPSSPFHSVSSFPLVKLADFGSCRGIHSRMPYTEYIATRWYRPPECLLFDGIYSYKMDIWGVGCVFFELLTKTPLFPGDDELDQLHRIHGVLGTPSERLLKVMVSAGTQAMVNAPNNQNNPKVVHHLAHGIFKKKFSFAPTKGMGFRGAFPQYVLLGAGKVPHKPHSTHPLSLKDYPGLTDECVNLGELFLQYDPDARPTARQALKHPWLKECRDAELAEKSANASSKELPLITVSAQSPVQESKLKHLTSNPEIQQTKKMEPQIQAATLPRNLPSVSPKLQKKTIPQPPKLPKPKPTAVSTNEAADDVNSRIASLNLVSPRNRAGIKAAFKEKKPIQVTGTLRRNVTVSHKPQNQDESAYVIGSTLNKGTNSRVPIPPAKPLASNLAKDETSSPDEPSSVENLHASEPPSLASTTDSTSQGGELHPDSQVPRKTSFNVSETAFIQDSPVKIAEAQSVQ